MTQSGAGGAAKEGESRSAQVRLVREVQVIFLEVNQEEIWRHEMEGGRGGSMIMW